jgi:hypothetical protein
MDGDCNANWSGILPPSDISDRMLLAFHRADGSSVAVEVPRDDALALAKNILHYIGGE